MTRRSFPRIDPESLRDHADDDRIERIWERIAPDLPSSAPSRGRSPVFAYIAIAASFAAFGAGLFVGKHALNDDAKVAVPAIPSSDRVDVDVLAAGTEVRTFPLPGGGQLTLQPGATVELERAGATDLTLKLVQGAASVDTASTPRGDALTIVAGEARLSAQAGSVLAVQRDQDSMNVRVDDGLVSVTSPAGPRQLGRGQSVDAVPLRAITTASRDHQHRALDVPPAHARVVPTSRRVAEAPEIEMPSAPAVGPEWLTRANRNDFSGALVLLKQEPGGIDGAINTARSAHELMTISDIARSKGADVNAAIKALTRLVEQFPADQRAQVAAYTLAQIFEKAGQTEQARKYYERAGKLSGALAEDAICGQMRAAQAAGQMDEASRRATEYVAQYPDGRCKDEAESILQSGGGSTDADAAVVEESPDASAP